MKNKRTLAHILALFTSVVWGTTFVSTRILITNGLSPHGIMFVRFIIGYIMLCILSKGRIKVKSLKEEFLFALAGLCGMTLYQLFENVALSYTQASNVSVLISIAPLITGILASRFSGEKLTNSFLLGFIISISGIFIIGLNDSFVLKISPKGDLLAILGAVVWGFYSIITKALGSRGYNIISVTRRIFFYGMTITALVMPALGFDVTLSYFTTPKFLFNLMYLGLIASAICFVTWNYAIKILGATKSSVYIYLNPLITMLFSVVFLSEHITTYMVIGTVLIVTGLLISEMRDKRAKKLS
ncbi:MAG: DMT family transporter [Clostridia bacterium]|nr:DMT family transporter [Clostridia bacterium]